MQPTRTAGAETPGLRPRRPYSVLLPVGFTVPWSVTGHAVGSYPTLSPLPALARGRFAFCGTVPGVAPAGRYPAPFSMEPGLSSTSAFRHEDAAAARPTGNGFM